MDLSDLALAIDKTADLLSADGLVLDGIRDQIVSIIDNDIKSTFENQRSPDGQPWAQEINLSGKRTFHQPLISSGALLAATIAAAQRITLSGNVIIIDLSSLPDYAQYQNDGTKTIPARQFIGISDSAMEELSQLIISHQLSELDKIWL